MLCRAFIWPNLYIYINHTVLKISIVISSFLYLRTRTKELIAEIDQSIVKFQLKKAIMVWMMLWRIKMFRRQLQSCGSAPESVIKVCKILLFSIIDAKLKELRKQRVKVRAINKI